MELEDWKKGRRFIEYKFDLGGPESNYTIRLKHVLGDLPDPISNHTAIMFSTKDKNNDKNKDSNCAHNYSGTGDACVEDNMFISLHSI